MPYTSNGVGELFSLLGRHCLFPLCCSFSVETCVWAGETFINQGCPKPCFVVPEILAVGHFGGLLSGQLSLRSVNRKLRNSLQSQNDLYYCRRGVFLCLFQKVASGSKFGPFMGTNRTKEDSSKLITTMNMVFTLYMGLRGKSNLSLDCLRESR